MIDLGKIDAPVQLTTEFILSKVSEEMIFFHYFGHFQLHKSYPSKLRADKTPSTGFFIHPVTGAILYNDMATGKKYNCFQFVAALHNTTFKDALRRIACDFGIINCNEKAIAANLLNQTIQFDRELKKETIIQFVPSEWQSHHIKYWKQYDIDIQDLKKNNVYPVAKLFVNKIEYKIDELCFAYIVKEKQITDASGTRNYICKEYIKIYQPHSKAMKWLSNVPIIVPFGLYELKYGTDHICIGKAQKDRMILLKFISSVIGSQNESESALPTSLVKHLCFNFPRRTIIWDADDTGVQNCKKFNSRGFGYFNTPKEFLEEGIKDVSDYVKAFGMKALEQLLIQKGII
jgi:hypothetical protein